MKYLLCEKCGNLYVYPNIEGVQLNCGAFVDYMEMEVDDCQESGPWPSELEDPEYKGPLGKIAFASVSSCGGTLKEITEEESQLRVEQLADKITFKGIRERK
jgi:hypothetical protein